MSDSATAAGDTTPTTPNGNNGNEKDPQEEEMKKALEEADKLLGDMKDEILKFGDSDEERNIMLNTWKRIIAYREKFGPEFLLDPRKLEIFVSVVMNQKWGVLEDDRICLYLNGSGRWLNGINALVDEAIERGMKGTGVAQRNAKDFRLPLVSILSMMVVDINTTVLITGRNPEKSGKLLAYNVAPETNLMGAPNSMKGDGAWTSFQDLFQKPIFNKTVRDRFGALFPLMVEMLRSAYLVRGDQIKLDSDNESKKSHEMDEDDEENEGKKSYEIYSSLQFLNPVHKWTLTSFMKYNVAFHIAKHFRDLHDPELGIKITAPTEEKDDQTGIVMATLVTPVIPAWYATKTHKDYGGKRKETNAKKKKAKIDPKNNPENPDDGSFEKPLLTFRGEDFPAEFHNWTYSHGVRQWERAPKGQKQPVLVPLRFDGYDNNHDWVWDPPAKLPPVEAGGKRVPYCVVLQELDKWTPQMRDWFKMAMETNLPSQLGRLLGTDGSGAPPKTVRFNPTPGLKDIRKKHAKLAPKGDPFDCNLNLKMEDDGDHFKNFLFDCKFSRALGDGTPVQQPTENTPENPAEKNKKRASGQTMEKSNSKKRVSDGDPAQRGLGTELEKEDGVGDDDESGAKEDGGEKADETTEANDNSDDSSAEKSGPEATSDVQEGMASL